MLADFGFRARHITTSGVRRQCRCGLVAPGGCRRRFEAWHFRETLKFSGYIVRWPIRNEGWLGQSLQEAPVVLNGDSVRSIDKSLGMLDCHVKN
jgi:hypothetical protein